MNDEATNDAQQRKGGRRVVMALVALLIVILVAVLVVWTQRRGIADDFLAGELARRDVTASYTVDQIGFRTQRLSNVVIGDPAHPDFVADWVEVDIGLGFSGASVSAVRVGPARLFARLQGGSVSFGQIDRLMPPPSGKPFALPELRVDIADLRVRLATQYGAVGLKVAGKGRLDDGFRGRLAAVAPQLSLNGCTARDVAIVGDLGIASGAPAIRGPARLGSLDCGATHAQGLRADLQLGLDAKFAHWRGDTRFALDRLSTEAVQARDLGGRIGFDGDAKLTGGSFDLDAAALSGGPGAARDVRLQGSFRLADRTLIAGSVAADHIAPTQDMIEMLAGFAQGGAGTPAAPLVEKLSAALVAAGRASRGDAQFSLAMEGQRSALAVTSLALNADSGARIRVDGRPAIGFDTGTGVRLNGTITMTGGGLPDGRIDVAQAAPGAAVTGRARFAPYAAGSARLALDPVDFRATPGGGTQIATRATLSGPLSGGSVDRLTLPIVAQWDGKGGISVNDRCVPASFQKLTVSALTLDPTRLQLCPEGAAMLRMSGGRMSGGVRTRDLALSGKIGGTPLQLRAATGRFGLAATEFALTGVETRIGAGESVTRLDVANLAGAIDASGVGGSFSGAAGQIGQVPLLLSEGKGDWTLADGKLTLDGGVQVADSAEEPRFNTLISDDVVLTLDGSKIDAAGTLHVPGGARTVTAVTLTHDLSAGSGQAVLDVEDLAFSPKGFQPDAVTGLTYGVIADVRGTVSGRGTIRWNGDGVTSTGSFRTQNTDLSAAFGPVTGLSTEIEFGDLLGMTTPEGKVQTATVTLLNPGIPVENGTIRYRLLSAQKIAIDDGRWPFAGGELILEPTVLDFGQQVERHMTFRVVGVDAARFLQEMSFDNVDATGVFDGVLPMVFDAKGGTIVGGELHSRNGGTVAYVGELTQEDLGFWGNYAFQALKSLRYRSLDLSMDGPLDGEMITRIRFAGVGQGEGARTNFITRRISKLPIVFNITIRAQFRQLARSIQSWYDPSVLIETQLPELLEQQRRETEQQQQSVQPDESEEMP
ncbi:intermembrane phospholipid transport protein YdbH family protein [Sphingosinithalassobacter portus]|uniref:intermembrane phospholipid transport protein YdbH family protein n=1 Tax=Stakelama portus TaxID=2676234 RepID=UPI000D6E388B|nr:YdbH domain-containing protein [Sphingosinithalassobacter portus]